MTETFAELLRLSTMTTMQYIIGLGNPGEKYEKTRHNVGRMFVETVRAEGVFPDWSKSKGAKAFYAHGAIMGEETELLLPETFMNRSGETVQYVCKKHAAKPEDFIVVHDDIDLPFGEVKISHGKGAGGNNGVSSIISTLSSKDFVRIRIGIAPKQFLTGRVVRPAGGGALEKFVLKTFSVLERQQLPAVFVKANEALELIVKDGVQVAMNKVN